MKADKKKVTRLLNIAKDQLMGVSKMIEDDRYCLGISNQLLAAIVNLRKANETVLCAPI